MRRRTERAKRPPLGHVRNATHGKVGGGIYGNSFYEEFTKPLTLHQGLSLFLHQNCLARHHAKGLKHIVKAIAIDQLLES